MVSHKYVFSPDADGSELRAGGAVAQRDGANVERLGAARRGPRFQTPYFGGEYSEDVAEHLQEIVLRETATMQRRICTSCTIRKTRVILGGGMTYEQRAGLRVPSGTRHRNEEEGTWQHKSQIINVPPVRHRSILCRRIRQAGVRLLRLKLHYRRIERSTRKKKRKQQKRGERKNREKALKNLPKRQERQTAADGSNWDTSGLSENMGCGRRQYEKPTAAHRARAELICDATTAATSCPYCGIRL